MSSPSTAHIAYDPPGFCVFCLRPLGQDFTDEHIIPRALAEAREIYIRSGSCSECNNRANVLYESSSLAHDLKTARYLLKLKRRRKGRKKKALEPHWATYDGHSDLDPEAPKISAEEYPPFIVFQIFPIPGILAHLNRCNLHENETGFVIRSIVPAEESRPGFRTIESRNRNAFALTIAKIGYTYAVAQHGLDAFDHNDIRALLRGERNDVFNFVGNDPGLIQEPITGLHRLRTGSTNGWLVAIVQLFARYGMPPYLVVVGRKQLS